jgi:hypothetical protein
MLELGGVLAWEKRF